MLKLYYLPGACSLVPHTALEWIGVDFDAQAVDHTIIKSPEYLALNPNGQVPLLQEGSWTLTQNVAILDYLNDVYPQAKLYGSGDARSVAYAREWLAFLNADLHKAFSLIFGAARFSEDESVQNAVRQAATAQALTLLARADHALAGQDYLAGERTIADVYLYVILRWAHALKLDLSGMSALPGFFGRIEADAGVQAALKQQGLL